MELGSNSIKESYPYKQSHWSSYTGKPPPLQWISPLVSEFSLVPTHDTSAPVDDDGEDNKHNSSIDSSHDNKKIQSNSYFGVKTPKYWWFNFSLMIP